MPKESIALVVQLAQILLAGALGGVLVAVINHFNEKAAEKRSRRAEQLRGQMQNLYGPLHFFTSQNEIHFARSLELSSAGHATWDGRTYIDSAEVQKQVSDDIGRVIQTMNDYSALVLQNNERIVEILQANYALIDVEDIEVFSRFLSDYAQFRTEYDEQKGGKLPLEIAMKVSPSSFMRPEFIERIRSRFVEKKGELDRLSK